MRARKTILFLFLLMMTGIILRKLGVSYAYFILSVSVYSLALTIILSNDIFRTMLAKVVLAASLIGAFAILQYWLNSVYIVIPTLSALLIFMILSYKYVVHKPSGVLLFVFIFSIFL